MLGLDFLKVHRFSFPVPVVGPLLSLFRWHLPQKHKIYQVELSLAFAAENITNLPLALRARQKICVRFVGKSMLGPEVLRGKDTTR